MEDVHTVHMLIRDLQDLREGLNGKLQRVAADAHQSLDKTGRADAT